MNFSQAIVAYEGPTTAVFECVLSQVVSSGTQGNYAYHNVDLLLWIYEREECREELLRGWMVERIIAAKEKGKKEMCATCKAALKEFNKIDDNCPIVLDRMEFNVFYYYISTKRSKKYGGYLSANIYGGVRSALTRLYRMSGKTMVGAFKRELSQFMSGMKKMLQLTRDNPVLVLMSRRRQLVLRCTKDYVKNYIMEKVMTIFLRMPS